MHTQKSIEKPIPTSNSRPTGHRSTRFLKRFSKKKKTPDFPVSRLSDVIFINTKA